MGMYNLNPVRRRLTRANKAAQKKSAETAAAAASSSSSIAMFQMQSSASKTNIEGAHCLFYAFQDTLIDGIQKRIRTVVAIDTTVIPTQIRMRFDIVQVLTTAVL
jgi:hypothetical protein